VFHGYLLYIYKVKTPDLFRFGFVRLSSGLHMVSIVRRPGKKNDGCGLGVRWMF
jgi:hypothetical protein